MSNTETIRGLNELNRLVLTPSWLDQLIGTETCSYCDTLTECLSLPNQEDTEYFACQRCIARAFDAAIKP